MDQQTDIPRQWNCPITQQIMNDPVIACDGFSYERKALENWLKKSSISPMTGARLTNNNMIPNHALRQTIQQYFEKYKKSLAIKQQEVIPGKQIKGNKKVNNELVVPDLQCQMDGIIHENDYYVALSIIPPVQCKSARNPISIVCVVDISQSMDTDSVLGGKNVQSHGFSRLDLVKHSLNTLIQFMGEQDQLALVTFNHQGKLYMPMTKTTNVNKNLIKNRIKALQASGTTNIWDGLKISLEILKERQKKAGSKDKNTFTLLLTDGEPNLNPPRGIVPTLKKFIQIEEMEIPNIHAFGYGYELDSNLLAQIAQTGSGTYTYIPDCSMVGTAFINFMSTALSTITNRLSVKLNIHTNVQLKRVLGFKKQKDNKYDLGIIQYGQNRQIYFQLNDRAVMGGIQNLGTIEISYGKSYEKNIVTDIPILLQPKNKEQMEGKRIRIKYLSLLEKFVSDYKPNLKEYYTMVDNFYDEIKKIHSENPSELTEQLLKQLKNEKSENQGQVSKSFEKQQWYNKWGKHYILSLLLAHTMQVCTNFKDPLLQLYGGSSFDNNRNNLDAVFIKMPPPQPTAKKQKNIVYKPAPVDMSDYYDNYGGCIYSECMVELINGSKLQIHKLKKGDQIKMKNNKIGILECLVETRVFDFVKMIKIGNLIITPWHPIYYQNKWQFPKQVYLQSLAAKQLNSEITQLQMFVETYYNFVMKDNVSMICQGIQCIALGHKINQDPVTAHEYFSQRVIQDLQANQRWISGKIKVNGHTRNPNTNQINGLKFIASAN